MAEAVIRVQGRGRLGADPDLAVLAFQVRGRSADYADAVERAARAVEAIRAAFGGLGVAGGALKTARFGVGREEEWDPQRQKRLFQGYAAVHALRLELPLSADAGAVLDAIVDAAPGADVHVSFELSDPDAFRQRLLAAAVGAARQNARTIADAAGVRLGTIAAIEYGPGDLRPMPLALEARAMRGGVPTAFEPEAIEGEETVTITWRIEGDQGVLP